MQTTPKTKLKKRKFKEIDSAWDLTLLEEDGQQSMVSNEESSTCTGDNSRQKAGNRRQIKLSYKKINKIATGMDLAKYSKNFQDKKIKEQA